MNKPTRYPNPRKKRSHPLLLGSFLLLFMALTASALYGLKMLQNPFGENKIAAEQQNMPIQKNQIQTNAASNTLANTLANNTAVKHQTPAAELITQIQPKPAAKTQAQTATEESKTSADALAIANAVQDQLDPQEYPLGRLADTLTFDKLYLEKSKRRLTAFAKGKAVRIYQIALGEDPIGHKQFQGDMKTPEGKYTINDKNPRSAYYKNVGISYPNKADRAYAAKHGKSAGGDIKIHGLAPAFASLGKLHLNTDWTYGCIAVTNPEMEEIYTRTPIGTPIEIVP